MPLKSLELFPAIAPNRSFYLPVSQTHQLYVEEVGNPNGAPVVFLHGGPGGGISENHRRLFDPEFYRIILFDQRGSGKSIPHASL
ncbi:MAG: prolyl aminopeptidase, partial [Cyanobacteria bacterium]|nr:prolyl aminopeptidase [Cyanobacteriota bacterium]